MIKKSIFILSLFSSVYADTIEFNNGAILNGVIIKQDTRTVSIKLGDKTTIYSLSDIKDITITQKVSAPPPPPASIKDTSERILEAGTPLHVKSISQIDSAHHKQGYQFSMMLVSDLSTKDGRVVAPKGSTLYGVVVSSKQAGRLIGKSELIITLTAIEINNKRIAIQTQSINLLNSKGQARDTLGKVARGAAIGGLVDGNDGARTGAKVGVGLAVVTRGKASGIAANTLIDFSLLSKLTVQ